MLWVRLSTARDKHSQTIAYRYFWECFDIDGWKMASKQTTGEN